MEPRILTDAEIEAIEERNGQRTQGEWKYLPRQAVGGRAIVPATGPAVVPDAWNMREEDCTFIAACSVDVPNLVETANALREALVGANWIISKLAPHEVLAIQVRGYRPTEEDIATGARYREMIEKALGEEAKRDGKLD